MNKLTSLSFAQKNGGRDDRVVNTVCMQAMFWPRKDRRGRRLNSSTILHKLLEVLESNTPEWVERTANECALRAVTGGDLPVFESKGAANRLSLDDRVDEDDFSESSYIPSYSVWRRLILSLSMEARKGPSSHWLLAQRAFAAMNKTLESYWPDSRLLKVGLEVAETTHDAALASDIVVRAQEMHFQNVSDSHNEHSSWFDKKSDVGAAESYSSFPNLQMLDNDPGIFDGQKSDGWSETADAAGGESNKDLNDPADDYMFTPDVTPLDESASASNDGSKAVRVPPQAFTTAMRVCIGTSNMANAERLLDCLRDSRSTIPDLVKSELYTLAMKGYAKKGDGDAAQTLLKEMQDGGPSPT